VSAVGLQPLIGPPSALSATSEIFPVRLVFRTTGDVAIACATQSAHVARYTSWRWSACTHTDGILFVSVSLPLSDTLSVSGRKYWGQS